LAPSDLHFFPHLKRDLKGTHFTSDDEVKQAVTSWIKQRTPELFIDGMRKLVLRWEKCIERQGDYAEKKVCQSVAKILYFISYFRLFKYMVSFSRYFTVCITYQPPLVLYVAHSVCLGLAIGSRTDLRSARIKQHVKQIQYVEPLEDFFLALFSPDRSTSDIGTFGYIDVNSSKVPSPETFCM
jgi:hypothetical protein